MPTDTIYGIVGLALNPKTVVRIYKLRRRNSKKPMIILIGSFKQLRLFGVKLSLRTKRLLKKFWPGRVSVVLPCRLKKFSYLHRDRKTLAFRMPKSIWLRKLLQKTGPLVAPSANWERKQPARTVKEARKYFGDKIDFYVDTGPLSSQPSTLIEIKRGQIKILRRGAAKI